MRPDLTKEQRKEVMEEIEKKAKQMELHDRKVKAKVVEKTPMIEYKIRRMLKRFRARYQKKKELIAQKEKEKSENESLLQLGKDAIDVEELMGTRGNAELSIEKFQNPADVNHYKDNPQKLGYEKLFMCFFDDIIAWKKKSSASNVEGKVFLVSILEIGSCKDLFMYFVEAADASELKTQCTS
jgi:hypothetical protein